MICLFLCIGISLSAVHAHNPIDVRIIGDNDNVGTVQVRYENMWGTVCANSWDSKAAIVVCRSVGYEHGQALIGKGFGHAISGTIWLDEVKCQGNEKSLAECSHRPWGINNCTHEQDAGVKCWNLKKKEHKSLPGAIYTRWGRTVCPNTATMVYSGYAGGSLHNFIGGGSNYLCLVKDAKYEHYTGSNEGGTGYIYGALYDFETYTSKTGMFLNKNAQTLHMKNVPCAVCETNNPNTIIMIPGTNTCYSGWKPEYLGYIMSGKEGSGDEKVSTNQYICMDNAPETLGFYGNGNSVRFYHAQTHTGALKMPPYNHGGETTCVVCSKDNDS